MSEIDTKFELCRDVEYVLKIGRDYQNKDGFRGAHYDTVKLLCDTIEYLRDQLPKPDQDRNAICERCHDGEIEPKECEYYGKPNGCNSPIYGEHPKANPGNAAAMREALKNLVDRTSEYIKECNPSIAGGCEIRRALENAKDAIAAPPRNCDVGTAEEQAERFYNFCTEHSSAIHGMCNYRCPCIDSVDKCHCLCKWAQMPYEEGGVTDGVQSAS